MEDFKNNNPLVFLLVFIAVGVALAGNMVPGFNSFGSGMSYRKRRALAKARAAKKRKARRRK